MFFTKAIIDLLIMTATSHALIGTVIAAKFSNPVLGISLAIASHIIADTIPHWDMATSSKAKGKRRMFYDSLTDVLLSFIVSYLLIYFLFPATNLIYAFIIIVSSQILDWLTAPYYFLGIEKPLFKSVYKFQKLFDHKLDKPWGIITQVVFVLLVILLGIVS